jgi:type VI secretion system protein ImpF
MARVRATQPLVPSLLDRLLDDDPAAASEPPANRTQLLADVRRSVRRDLELLLNTRQRLPAADLPKAVRESILGYGLADFSGQGPTSGKDVAAFCRVIADQIRRYEPRLTRVVVEPVTDGDPLDRTLRFRIDAMLLVDPAPEPIAFESALEPATGTIRVGGSE